MGPISDSEAGYDVVESSTAFRSGRVIDVRTDIVAMPGGDTATRDVVVHPGAVGIIALDHDEQVLLVQQYRHPVQHKLWEPPAGLLDHPDEDPLSAAQRELFEEAHHRADRWDVLIDAFTSPGMTDESVRIYLARDVSRADEPRHTGEHEERDMPVAWTPLDDALALALAGKLHNPMAVMGLFATAYVRSRGYRDLRPADAPWPQLSPWPGSRAAPR